MMRALRHCLREAWDGLRRYPSLSLLSAAAIGIPLYVLGLFLLLAFNFNRFVASLGQEVQAQVYLEDTAGPEQIEALRAELSTDPAVATARFVSREEALQRFKRTFPALRDLPGSEAGNPFPASFELELKTGYRDLEAMDRLVKSYREAPGVEDLRYDPGWVQRLAGIVDLVESGGYGIGALLLLAALVTVAAVIRLSVLARSEEIEIMKLVGATPGFIRGPFLVGALAQGLAGGTIAVGGLLLTHRLLERSAIFKANPFMSIAAGSFLPLEASMALAIGGALLGLLAALLSLRRAGTY
jgi:cell division transport system permease protein